MQDDRRIAIRFPTEEERLLVTTACRQSLSSPPPLPSLLSCEKKGKFPEGIKRQGVTFITSEHTAEGIERLKPQVHEKSK
jgi:hypothetical protein